MDAELETLDKLTVASQKCFGLALYEAYKTLPQEHIRSLIQKGLWYQLSMTQGNITKKGNNVLLAAKEQENHAAVRKALVEEARAFGYELVETDQREGFRPEGEIFRLTRLVWDEAHLARSVVSGFITLEGTAQFALFLVEERLCRAGKIR